MKNLFLAATLVAFSALTTAEENPVFSNTNGILGAGYAFGGDKLEGAVFTDGSRESVKAGEGLWIDFGFRSIFSDWALKATLGYKFDSIVADNGDITVDRLPLTFIGQYMNGDHNFGFGFTYELSPSLDVDLPGDRYSIDFKDALGFVLEYEKNEGSWGWGARYTFIDYDAEEYSDNSATVNLSNIPAVDGNNFAIFANWYF